jgi:L-lactate dehydrogenase complex protein LldG
MSTAREEILERIRTVLRGAPPYETPEGPGYRRVAEGTREDILALFMERAGDYRSEVRRVPPGAARGAIEEILALRGVRHLVIPAGFPDEWRPQGADILAEDAGAIENGVLDTAEGVLTTCAVAIALTGTVVLDGGAGQGRRALTLLPDYHLCVVQAEQIVELVPEAIAQLQPAAEARRPLTFISGPSATSDIELTRVEGVHGPRTLDVLVVG